MKIVTNLASLTMQTAQELKNDLFFVMEGKDYPSVENIITIKDILFSDYKINDGLEIFTYAVAASEKPDFSVLDKLQEIINTDIDYTQQNLLVVCGNVEIEINHPFLYHGMKLVDMRYDDNGYYILDIAYNK
jgi:hypothetical protein